MTQKDLDEFEKLRAQKERRNLYMKMYMRRRKQATRQQTQGQPQTTPE